jgi:hypothetical protein
LPEGIHFLKYQSPSSYQSKAITKVKVFEKKGQTPRSKIKCLKSWHQMKGLARRNTLVKYESTSTYQSNVMTKFKVFNKKGETSRSKSVGQGNGIK